MNRRERFLATMTFGHPDRPASGDYFYYDSTRERWEREGLPKGVDLDEHFQMDFNPFRWRVPVSAVQVVPAYPEQVLDETAQYKVVRRGAGEVVRILKDAPPPAMPQWIRHPIESRSDWEAFRARLDPDTPGRLPENLAELAQ